MGFNTIKENGMFSQKLIEARFGLISPDIKRIAKSKSFDHNLAVNNFIQLLLG